MEDIRREQEESEKVRYSGHSREKKRGAHCWLNRPLGYVDVMVID